MPLNAVPPTVDGAAFDAKVAAAAGRAHVDVALWGGLVPGDLDRLDELAARGVVGFKAFMSASGVEEFPAADDLTLLEGMARAARLGLPVAVHAESDAITSALARRAVAAGRTAMRDYLASRPVVAELEAIGRALAFAAETGCALHVVHVSTGRGVALVAGARARGVDVTCETCPHYLVLDADDAERIGALAKCAPPLRAAAEREGLWAALDDVALVATDHSPSPAELKHGGPPPATTCSRRGAGSPARRRSSRSCTTRASSTAACRSAGSPSCSRPRRRAGSASRPSRARSPSARTPTSPCSTPPARGRSRATTCSTATGSARSPAGRCAAASCGRSCAAAQSRSTGA